jgi:hypothetical protein
MNYLRPWLADERVGFVTLDRQQSEGGRLDRDRPRRLLLALRRRAAAASGRIVLGQAREGGEKARGASVEGIAHGQCSVTEATGARASGWGFERPAAERSRQGVPNEPETGSAARATTHACKCNPSCFPPGLYSSIAMRTRYRRLSHFIFGFLTGSLRRVMRWRNIMRRQDS